MDFWAGIEGVVSLFFSDFFFHLSLSLLLKDLLHLFVVLLFNCFCVMKGICDNNGGIDYSFNLLCLHQPLEQEEVVNAFQIVSKKTYGNIEIIF